MRLNLGCSTTQEPDYINVDIVQPCDYLADLSKPWPWAYSTIGEIRAHDIIEHLPDKILTMNEAWRVLVPGGVFEIKVPTTDGPGAWQDPQHVSYWNLNSFLYYVRGIAEYERFHGAYGITACFDVVKSDLHTWPNKVVDLNITLRAIK